MRKPGKDEGVATFAVSAPLRAALPKAGAVDHSLQQAKGAIIADRASTSFLPAFDYAAADTLPSVGTSAIVARTREAMA